MLYDAGQKGGITLKRRFYRTGEFARRASVTERALRYYDAVGLLSPRRTPDSGYRLYADEDLLTLQRILALKFLGFSLEEVRLCLRKGPRRIPEILARQKAMLREKRAQIDAVLAAIEKAEALTAGAADAAAEQSCDFESLVGVIRVMQMQQKQEWVKKYFTDEQLRTMDELSENSYSPEARERLEQRSAGEGFSWTEEDQKRADEQWRHVAAEARRLAEVGADPSGDEAQSLAKFKSDLLGAFTMGDPEIAAGVARFWDNFHSLPAGQQPFDASVFSAGEEGERFLEQAMTIYQERQRQG